MPMGTDAILFYGITFGHHIKLDVDLEGKFGGDFEEFYAFKKGLTTPEETRGSNDSEKTRDDYKQYWSELQRINQESGCEAGRCYSDDNPMVYVCIAAGFNPCPGKYVAFRGEVVSIPESLTPQPEWDDLLKQYCETMGFPYWKPSWQLISCWG